jgi:hypothetical protein
MDVRIKELLRDKLNARNFEFNSKEKLVRKVEPFTLKEGIR